MTFRPQITLFEDKIRSKSHYYDDFFLKYVY